MMASDQFILEMYKKLHPGSDIHDVGDLTGADVAEINAIVDDKHAIRIGSDWLACEEIKVDLRVLRNIMTSASLSAHAGLKKQDAMLAGSLTDADGKFDHEEIAKWEVNRAYYQEQEDTVKIIEKQILDRLREETNQPGFYMRGVKHDDQK